MFGVFIGEHDNKVDDKGRVSIPADFRRVLEDEDPRWESGKNPSMVIVYGDNRRNYLEVFTIEGLTEVHSKIKKMKRGSKKRAELQKLYSAQATVAQVDDTGRIVLMKKLRDKLGIKGRAYVVGNGDTFQIWEPETYQTAGLPGLQAEPDYDPALDPSVYLPGDEEDEDL